MNTTVANNRQSPRVVEGDDIPQPLYHGTDVELQIGDLIVPGRECGRGRGEHVWMTPSQTSAFGWAVSKRNDNRDWKLQQGQPSRVVYVYEVEPVDIVETCRSAYRSRRARVTGIVGAWW